MRKISFWLTVFTILITACTRSYHPTSTPAAIPPAALIPLTTTISTPSQAPTQALEPITVNTYGCLHTGIVFLNGDPAGFECNLGTREAAFTFAFGETVNTALFASPEPVAAGQSVSITTYANIGNESGTCVLTDSRTGAPLQSTLILQESLTIHSDCLVGGKQLTMAYNIKVIPSTCVPTVIWESQTPENFNLKSGGVYLVEVAFPNVTGVDAWWAHETSWVEIATTGPLTFLGAVGKAFEFQNSCSDWDRMEWETHNLVSPPNLLENFLHAGVVK